MAKGKVYLVGSGPGDPDLLTVKALRLLRTADIVFHDDLVSPQILSLIPAAIHVESVGKRCGHISVVTQQQIHSLLINASREGWTVVRLKSGDPLVFGRAGEEMEALRQAGIDFEVVPGITAAFGAAAQARIPLTDRRLASKIVFLSNHCCAGKVVPDWRDSISRDATILVYMPGADYEGLTAKLRAAGLEAQTPCLLISQATSAQQRVHPTTLADLAKAPRLPAPLLLVIGAVARQYSRQAIDADMPDGLPTPAMMNDLAMADALVE
jgi:uroporphyrin-III C-methyltransferase